jgi:DNA-directed RNA polymerase subunit RPC12/RpoP
VLPLPCGNCGHRTTRKGDRYGCTHCGAEVVPLPSAA